MDGCLLANCGSSFINIKRLFISQLTLEAVNNDMKSLEKSPLMKWQDSRFLLTFYFLR